MAEDNRVQMPGAFGGLMRYDDEFTSKLLLSPAQVLTFVLSVLLFVLLLYLFFPIKLGV